MNETITLEQITAREHRTDPGLTTLGQVTNQICSLLTNSTNNVVVEMTKLRSELDDMMHEYRDHENKVLDLIARHHKTGVAAVKVKDACGEALKELRSRLEEASSEIAKVTQESLNGGQT